jgi:hypothetical protein
LSSFDVLVLRGEKSYVAIYFAVSFVYKSMRMLFVICVCRSSSCHNLAGALLCHFSLLHHSTRPLHCSSPARSKQAKG